MTPPAPAPSVHRAAHWASLAALAGAIVLGPTAAWSQVRMNRGEKPKVRAKQPAAWDKTTESAFFPDAFATLEGERPDFAAAAAAGSTQAGAAAPATGGAPAAGGFKWSSLVSADTLVDEIKEMKGVAAKAVSSASDFKGGGYNDARQAFSSIALAFAVIADFDGDARFKKESPAARGLFARVGNNCKVGTQQSFDESKVRVADLDALLQGNPLDSRPESDDEELTWSKIAARPALMTRLETADEIANAAVASKDDFTKQVEKLLHEVEIVAMIGEAIQRPDHEYHDDDTYRGYAAQMRDAAVKARAAIQRSDYDAARGAIGEMKKSCDTCHGDYRS
jgi:hypothetical protein